MAVCVLFPAFAWGAQAKTDYRFDDVQPHGVGAQWIVLTDKGGAIGDVATVPIRTAANFLNKRDHVYLLNQAALNGKEAGNGIDAVFLVIPEREASITLSLNRMPPYPASGDHGQDLFIDFGAYDVKKTKKKDLALPDASSTDVGSGKSWEFAFRKKEGGAARFGTARGYMVFHQSSSSAPTQTLQLPIVVANVRSDTAEGNPLVFGAALRDGSSGAEGGNIVAYDRFTWDVTADMRVRSSASWVLVPVKTLPVSSNKVDYTLVTDITNYCGIRYALQRYDGRPLTPIRWAMDLPGDVKDVDSNLVLDELSHIPPGLVTTYVQPFDVTSPLKTGVFKMYPVPQYYRAIPFRDLDLAYNTVYGQELGKESGTGYEVMGFSLLPADIDFLKKLASATGVKKAEMVGVDDKVLGGAVSADYVGGDVIGAVSIASKIPDRFPSSGDVRGVLPLHITFNLPRSDRAVSQVWDELLAEWKRTGDIQNSFAKRFALYMRDTKDKNLDLTQWLRGKGVFDRVAKVFLDESRDCLTVSFIVMLMDGSGTDLVMVKDRSMLSDNSYLVIRDGSKNRVWDMGFFVAPIHYAPSDMSTGGGGGGGCNGGSSAPLFSLVALLSAFLVAPRGRR